ncbi:MAG: SigB/SigF/SigG family RNA polymerase sigma factor [Firmicutes bacterium]|nr:SigB/SigF/SigG family RNA polymerase sigma factor [Bacillota bacterium]
MTGSQTMNYETRGILETEPLSAEELNALLAKAKQGDLAARDRVVQANLRLVASVTKRFLSFGYEFDDLFQIGCFGLLKAIERFELERGLMFSTYAVPLIIGEIRSFIRDDGPVKISRSIRERYLKVEAIRRKYVNEYGEEPSLAELAELTGISAEELVVILDASAAPVSLDETIYEGEGRSITRQEVIPSPESNLDQLTDKLTLEKAITALPERERQILLLRYIQKWSQAQIAERFGISQVHVSRLLRKALKQAQEALES